jgi:hypothetical protein
MRRLDPIVRVFRMDTKEPKDNGPDAGYSCGQGEKGDSAAQRNAERANAALETAKRQYRDEPKKKHAEKAGDCVVKPLASIKAFEQQ